MNERMLRIEEKLAYLERHVTEQDKAMLELAEDVVRLRAEVQLLRERLGVAAEHRVLEPTEERPPHY